MEIGVPGQNRAVKALLLGSGELGKELTMELMKLGIEVIACDKYEGAPAMQVAHRHYVFDMLDGDALEAVIRNEQPDFIIPEVEAIATDKLVELEKENFNVVPTAKATKLTMDREGIRRLAAEELGLETARYQIADNFQDFKKAALAMGLPLVVKPIMSSSGKGQSVIKTEEDIKRSWDYAQNEGRAGAGRVILEEFIDFESEITLLTIRAVNGTHFCAPIGHKQKDGDYVESWQPHPMSTEQQSIAESMGRKICDALGGYGLFGVELFLLKDGRVLFSEVSPRPHDTGMVTMMSQEWSEFALHARAILGLPIQEIKLNYPAASAALKSDLVSSSPIIKGAERVYQQAGVDLHVFAKPNASLGRRMAVILARGDSVESSLKKACTARECLEILP